MEKQQNEGKVHIESAFSQLKDRSPLELIQEMEDAASAMSDTDFDEELIAAYLFTLQEKAPLDTAFDPEASYQRFREKNASLFEDIPSKQHYVGNSIIGRNTSTGRRRFRPVIAAAVLMVIVFLSAVAPIASGKTVFQVILNWGEEVFHLSRYSGQVTQDRIVEELESGQEFLSMEDALMTYGLNAMVCPSWIPRRFSLSVIDILDDNTRISFYALYLDEQENSLMFLIDYNPSSQAIYTIEKDHNSEYIYSKNYTDYYLFTNEGLWGATWADESSFYSLEGAITEDELLKMIDSIYER